MPRDPETGMSRGYLFIEFQTAEIAGAVAKIANGYRLDKSHVLSALKFADFEGLKSCRMNLLNRNRKLLLKRNFEELVT